MTDSGLPRGENAWVREGEDTPAALLEQGVYVPGPHASLEERLGRELAAMGNATGPALRRVTEDPELLARVVQRLQVEVRSRRATGIVTRKGVDPSFAGPVALRLGLPLHVAPAEGRRDGGEPDARRLGPRPVLVAGVLDGEPGSEHPPSGVIGGLGGRLQAAVAVFGAATGLGAGAPASGPGSEGSQQPGRENRTGGLPEVMALCEMTEDVEPEER